MTDKFSLVGHSTFTSFPMPPASAEGDAASRNVSQRSNSTQAVKFTTSCGPETDYQTTYGDATITSQTQDQFSQAYELEFVSSELVIAHQFNFCGLCLSQSPGQHASNCLKIIAPKACEQQLEAKEFLTVNVFKHMPPRVDGCPLEDSQCAACQLALAPSPSF